MSYPVYIDVTDPARIHVRRSEVRRYLGYGRIEMSPDIEALTESLIAEAKQLLRPRACYTRLPVLYQECPSMDLGFGIVRSQALWNNLRRSDKAPARECFIFAATIGPAIDRQIRKYASLSPAKSAVLGAVGAACIESYCDLLEGQIAADASREGLALIPRFSPGYGDFSLEHQRDFFRVLDPPRRAGISLTDQLLMVPEKSVTAVIGLTAESSGRPEPLNPENPSGRCGACPDRECAFRMPDEE